MSKWRWNLVFAFFVWLPIYTVTVGGMNAYLQHFLDFPSDTKDDLCAKWKSDYRDHLAFSVGWALLPPALLIAPFATGFYRYGLEYGYPVCSAKEPTK